VNAAALLGRARRCRPHRRRPNLPGGPAVPGATAPTATPQSGFTGLGVDPDVRNGFETITVRFAIDASREDLQALIAQSQKRSAAFDIVTNPTKVRPLRAPPGDRGHVPAMNRRCGRGRVARACGACATHAPLYGARGPRAPQGRPGRAGLVPHMPRSTGPVAHTPQTATPDPSEERQPTRKTHQGAASMTLGDGSGAGRLGRGEAVGVGGAGAPGLGRLR
jgi:hypothetical protein